MTPHEQTVFARLVMASLVRAGARELVVCPGSRSTPFALAAAEVEGLTLFDAHDERAGAFFALGIAKARGIGAVLTTSGTAPAHCYPAVIEASEARVPLVVLSANRPAHLQGCGAAQTTDQAKLFGGHARAFLDLAAGAPPRAMLAACERTLALARGPVAGPVHLDLHADKPLEPALAKNDAERALDVEVSALLARAPLRIDHAREVGSEAIASIADELRSAERGVVIAGPLAPGDGTRDAAQAVARAMGAPLLAETTSQLRGENAFFSWYGREPRFLDRAAPDVVLRLGRTPTSPAYASLCARAKRHVVIADAPSDPDADATHMVCADVPATLRALAAAMPGAKDSALQPLVTQCEVGVRAILEDERDEALFEGEVARVVAAALPARGTLVIGNSLPVRLVDDYPATWADGVRVVSQRGVNGIDGLVSGALGVSAVDDAPLVLLVGDVSFLHDVGALSLAKHARGPVAIVIVDNRGGRIFEALPVAAHASERAMRLFTTPHEADLSAAARLFGVPFARADREGALRAALDEALTRHGASIVQAVVPPHDAQHRAARIMARVRAELQGWIS